MSPNAEDLAKDAEAAAAKADKPLPELRSPMTRLPEEIRKVVATWCKTANTSFSRKTVLFWITFLKAEKLVPADLAIDLTPQRGGASFRAKEKDYQDEIEKLKADLVAARAAKK